MESYKIAYILDIVALVVLIGLSIKRFVALEAIGDTAAQVCMCTF
jgi:hypothetical protein